MLYDSAVLTERVVVDKERPVVVGPLLHLHNNLYAVPGALWAQEPMALETRIDRRARLE